MVRLLCRPESSNVPVNSLPIMSRHRYLTLDELSPTVHLAACFEWKRERHRYRIPSHHVLLIQSGKIDAETPEGSFTAEAGSLICFHPADWNEYGTRETA